MSAATQAVNTPIRTSKFFEAIPVAANINIYNGVIAAVDASGNLNPAADTAGLRVLGRAEGVPETIDTGALQLIQGQDAINNPGSAGAVTCNVRRGIFGWANSSTNPVTKAMVKQPCYVQDSQTVCDFAGSTNKIVAGIIIGIEPSSGLVWVDTRGRVSGVLAPTSDAITDSTTGTAPTITDGAVTMAAISSTGTAANAIAGLIAQIKLMQADIQTLFTLLS